MKIATYFYTVLFGVACLSSLAALKAEEEGQDRLKDPSGTQMVTIGDPHNPPYKDKNKKEHGAVSESYQLGRYEFTVLDWKEEVLDNVATTTDKHHLWNRKMEPYITRKENPDNTYTYTVVPEKEFLPITHLDIYSCGRACNIQHNKEKITPGVDADTITEVGSYTITTEVDGTQHMQRNEEARYCIPTLDQVLKAGYYDTASKSYYQYPTGSDTNPGDLNSSTLDNKANYKLHYSLKDVGGLSPVNAYGQCFEDSVTHKITLTGTVSPYGCIDMAGNVNEWTSTPDEKKDEEKKGENYFVQGGSYQSAYGDISDNELMRDFSPKSYSSTTESDTIGFRMAAVSTSNDSSTFSYYDQDHSDSSWAKLTTAERDALVLLAIAGVAAGGTYAVGLWTLADVSLGICTGGAAASKYCSEAVTGARDWWSGERIVAANTEEGKAINGTVKGGLSSAKGTETEMGTETEITNDGSGFMVNSANNEEVTSNGANNKKVTFSTWLQWLGLKK